LAAEAAIAELTKESAELRDAQEARDAIQAKLMAAETSVATETEARLRRAEDVIAEQQQRISAHAARDRDTLARLAKAEAAGGELRQTQRSLAQVCGNCSHCYGRGGPFSPSCPAQ
jgi:hypothetical protein